MKLILKLALSFNIKLALTILVLFALLIMYLYVITISCMRILYRPVYFNVMLVSPE